MTGGEGDEGGWMGDEGGWVGDEGGGEEPMVGKEKKIL